MIVLGSPAAIAAVWGNAEIGRADFLIQVQLQSKPLAIEDDQIVQIPRPDLSDYSVACEGLDCLVCYEDERTTASKSTASRPHERTHCVEDFAAPRALDGELERLFFRKVRSGGVSPPVLACRTARDDICESKPHQKVSTHALELSDVRVFSDPRHCRTPHGLLHSLEKKRHIAR